MHFKVELLEKNHMNMLYKLGDGYVEEEHYGLALAAVVDLPPIVLEIAEEVSNTLVARAASKKKSSQAFLVARRRKLVLALQETLTQARDGSMDGKVLLSWLRKVQEEFITRMEQLEKDAATNSSGSDRGDWSVIEETACNERGG